MFSWLRFDFRATVSPVVVRDQVQRQMLQRFGINLLPKRRICGWNDDFLIHLLGIKAP